MKHILRNFEPLVGQIPGLSEKQLRAHFGLYEGYVKKINEIEERLRMVDPSSANYSFGEISELLRRRAVPYNGAVLHERYFENLTGRATAPSPELRDSIDKEFGSLENWMIQAKAGLLSAHGWVLLTRSAVDGSLRNDLVEEHHHGVLAEQDILLSIDGWEHAYMIDYGTAKKDYVDMILRAIDWEIASARFRQTERATRSAA
jgi:superoxide dismutase, Fe-Mn family